MGSIMVIGAEMDIGVFPNFDQSSVFCKGMCWQPAIGADLYFSRTA